MQIARMESRGPQFPIIVRVHGVLGQRAVGRRMSALDLDLLMGRLCRDLGVTSRPASSTTRKWASENRGLPEWAIRSGLVRLDQIRPWARGFLTATAAMEQGPAAVFSARADRSENVASFVAQAIAGVAIVYAGARISSWLFGANQTENGPGKNRRPRRPFRFAR